MTFFSTQALVLNPLIMYYYDYEDNNFINRFLYNLSNSVRNFDIIWIIFAIFIYNYFYNNYIFEKNITKEKKYIIFISLWLSTLIMTYISLDNYNNLNMFFYSSIQIYKSITLVLGISFFICTFLNIIYLKFQNK